MRQVSLKFKNAVALWLIYPVSCALVVIGAKCWMIAGYGSSTPFWDEWDAEGALLFPKYVAGTLTFSDLLAPHNEHRILFTRLWSLLLLILQGYWDPIGQMLANTLVLGAMVALLVSAFRRVLPSAYWIVFVLVATLIFSLPWTWFNSLSGFSSQWYFVLLFSLAGIVAITEAAAFSPRWWIAVVFLLFSYFSMAGGTAAAAAFFVCAVQMAVGARRGVLEVAALAIVAAMTVIMVLSVPALSGHAWYKAHSLLEFLLAFIEIMSWPAATGLTFVATLVVLAITTQAPAVLASVDVMRLRQPITDRRWLLLALTGWIMLNAATVAYGRAAVSVTARYLDLFEIGLLVDVACFLYLVSAYPALWRRRQLIAVAFALWPIPILTGTTLTVVKHSLRDLADQGEHAKAQTENMRTYLATGDIRLLQNKAELDIPYSDANQLAAIASQPVIRALLPPALVGEANAARAQQRGLAQFTGRPFEALKNFGLRWGALLILAGAVLFVLGLAAQRRRPVVRPVPSRI